MTDTGDLTGLRDAIAAAIAATGIPAAAYFPDRLNPPVALVQPGSPYVEPSDDTGYSQARWIVRHEVILLVGTGDKRLQTTSLDALIETSLGAIYRWGVTQVGQPYVLQVGESALYLASRIQLVTTIPE